MLTVNVVPIGDFKQTYNHSHTDLSVHWIHEDIADHSKSIARKRGRLRDAYNSSRQRIGAPIASQTTPRSVKPKPPLQRERDLRESNKQMVENDFSPPDSVIVLRPLCSFRVSSGSTYAIFSHVPLSNGSTDADL